MKTYAVKSLFYTLQGEGVNAGRPAVFCRFAGCNLWSGREEDRGNGGSCAAWCDTDFVGTDGEGGGQFTRDQLADSILRRWPTNDFGWVVFTGGEPLLQLDADLIRAVRDRAIFTAVETNGTIEAPVGINWLTVSPKAGTTLIQRSGDELKLIYPQYGFDPREFLGLSFEHFVLSPMDGPHRERHTQDAVAYCLANPQWRLSLQTHKILGIP